MRDMPEQEYTEAVRQMVAKITVIAGCHIEEKLLRTTLSAVKNFLRSYFGFLTPAEVVCAFEMNSAGLLDERISHYNRSLNCEYIGSVLKLYKEYRGEQMRAICLAYESPELDQQVKQLPINKAEVTDDDRRNILEIAYTMHLGAPSAGLIGADMLYDYALKFGLVEPIGHRETEAARNRLVGRLYMQLQAITHTERTGEKVVLQRKIDILKSGMPSPEEGEDIIGMVTSCAKEISIMDFFKTAASAGKKTIFA